MLRRPSGPAPVSPRPGGFALRGGDADTRLVTTDEVRAFDRRLVVGLQFAERAAMSVSRLEMAHTGEELGGWPEGFEFPDHHVAACALLADVLENEVGRMQKWATALREHSAYLRWVRGPGVADDAR